MVDKVRGGIRDLRSVLNAQKRPRVVLHNKPGAGGAFQGGRSLAASANLATQLLIFGELQLTRGTQLSSTHAFGIHMAGRDGPHQPHRAALAGGVVAAGALGRSHFVVDLVTIELPAEQPLGFSPPSL